ncbi:YkgJ family protein [Candidatus Gastranaerophilus sp. (ex Termes propinquus)]|nr:YkgJ family protein [Candidatus Gastranaerophilus sp. (ex Termes propinquus)]
MKKFVAILQMFLSEFMSYFVPERSGYKIVGECLKCGKCCNYMYCQNVDTKGEFKVMQFLYPSYRRLYIKGEDAQGNLVFACKDVTSEGLCAVYKKRPKFCKEYPKARAKWAGGLHGGCGYEISLKKFEDYLTK